MKPFIFLCSLTPDGVIGNFAFYFSISKESKQNPNVFTVIILLEIQSVPKKVGHPIGRLDWTTFSEKEVSLIVMKDDINLSINIPELQC